MSLFPRPGGSECGTMYKHLCVTPGTGTHTARKGSRPMDSVTTGGCLLRAVPACPGTTMGKARARGWGRQEKRGPSHALPLRWLRQDSGLPPSLPKVRPGPSGHLLPQSHPTRSRSRPSLTCSPGATLRLACPTHAPHSCQAFLKPSVAWLVPGLHRVSVQTLSWTTRPPPSPCCAPRAPRCRDTSVSEHRRPRGPGTGQLLNTLAQCVPDA